jgi:fatty-acyl-CoA synthase
VEDVIARFPGVGAVVVFPVPDARTGDQVMATVEVDGSFDAAAFDAFLAAQSDLGKKWLPRFVRVVDAIPLTATGKVDRKPLRAERWSADDVWWRPSPKDALRPMSKEDVRALHDEFAAAGRARVIA